MLTPEIALNTILTDIRQIYDKRESESANMEVKLRADQILQERRSEEFQDKLAHCLKERLPFILYEDETRFGHGNYYLIIPSAMKMVCYMNRQVRAETVSTTVNSFLNNLHLAIAAYDRIWVPEKKSALVVPITNFLPESK